MKKKNIILFIVLPLLLCVHFTEVKAQSEVTIPTPKKGETASSEILDSNFKSDTALTTLATYRFNPELNPYYSFMKNNPISLNYDMSEHYKFSERLYITPYNKQAIYLGLGNYKNIGVSLKWKPLSNLSIEGGIFHSLQYGYILASRHRTNGFNLNLDYDISDKLQWSIYGQYTMEENKDPFLETNSELPKDKIGTSLKYNSKENTQIGVGMEYQYNRQDQKWKPEAKAKVSLGF